jgi:hypothetical protein
VKDLFNYIKEQVNARVPDPQIKTVRMWNNQLLHSNSTAQRTTFRDEKPFKYPACFVEFIVDDVNNLPLGITDYILTVRYRFGVERYKFERLETFDFCDNFLATMHLLAPTGASGLTFTTFQLIKPEFDEDHNNVEAPYIDYRTRYRHIPSYTRATDVLHGPITPNAIGDIIEIADL